MPSAESYPNPGLAIANMSRDMHHDTQDQVIISSFLYNLNEQGHLLLERVANDFPSQAAGKWHAPGIALKFNEHPEEAAHRILTEELEVADRPLCLLRVQSHHDDGNRWYLMFLYESEPLTEEELANPCEGISELAYHDPNKIYMNDVTSAVWDIIEADKIGNRTYR